MPVPHFQRLLECLDLEAAAAAEEATRLRRSQSPEQAERMGTCLTGLVIRDESAGFGARCVVTLGKRDRTRELPWSRLTPGSPVLLTEQTETSDSGWRGVVTNRDRETITIVLNESPEPVADRPLFRLDLSADEISRLRQRDALRTAAAIDRGRLKVLKDCLVGDEPPVFQPAKEWTPLSKLDESQRAAVSHALSAEQIAVIHGPPGTGKTTTVVELIRQAVRRGERVLACAPSNLAVDNLLERLLAAGERALRIGHPARVLPELRNHTLDVQVADHPDLKLARDWIKQAWVLRRDAKRFTRAAPPPGARRDAREEASRLLRDAREIENRLVEYLLDSATVVCSTLTGLNEELLGQRQFDLVVIDEAGQTTEPACWIPLLRSRRVVLAGDHCQLPPTVISPAARRHGFHLSLLERVVGRWDDHVSRRLTTQYRMHEQIMRFSSDEFYESQLIAADAVRSHRLADLSAVSESPLTDLAVQFYDTAGSHCEEKAEADGESLENPGEADYVVAQANSLLAAGVRGSDIAIITPYSAQARRLRDAVTDPTIEVDTVDGFQGREKEAVIISLVRSNPRGELGFLKDTRRLNVALTRARRKLIIFGDSATLANHEFYLRLLTYFETQNAYGTIWEIPLE